MADITTSATSPSSNSSTPSSSPFDLSLNNDLHQNTLDATTLNVGNVLDAGVATITDIGASLWNSLPGTPNVDTADLLSGVSKDALSVYNQHPDAIHAASFIGGMLLPMGIASKGIGLMRSGLQGASWFSEAGRAADMAKAAEMISEAGGATTEYRDLVRGIYAKSAVNQAIDAVAMEAALVALYHAHPLMEDYMQDPVKNFGISAAFGGVIGGAVGHIADRFALRALTGAEFEKGYDATVGTLRAIAPDMTNSTALQSHWLNQQNLDAIMAQRAELGKNETNDLIFSIARTEKQNIAIKQQVLFEDMISPEISNLPKDQKDVIMQRVIDNPEMFGVDDMRLLTAKEVTAEGVIKAPVFPLEDKPSLVATQSSKGPIEPVNKDAVYFPDLDLYGVKSDAIHYAGASTLGKSADSLGASLPYNYGKIPNLDSSVELVGKSSAQAEAEYIAAMVRVDKMSVKDLARLNISETDGPLLNAVVTRMAKDPEAAKVLVNTVDRSAVYDQILAARTNTLVAEGKIPAGPSASYTAAVDSFAGGKKIESFNPLHTGDLSNESKDMLVQWIGGDLQPLRKAAADYFATKTGSSYAKGSADSKLANTFGELYESSGSQSLRQEFGKIADSDGNVYLYRGVKKDADEIRGHAPVESYTTHIDKAAQFVGHNTRRGVKLYKVHVDDIVAGFKDVGGGENNAEILVRAPARPVEAELDAAGNAAFKAKQATEESANLNRTGASFEDLQNMLLAQKQDAIDSLLANGIPMESIAKKTNTSLDALQYYAHTKQNGGSLADLLTLDSETYPSALATNGIKSLADAEKVLAPTNQPIVLSGNLRKNQYIEGHASLTNKEMSDMNKELSALIMVSSNSSAAKEMGQFLYSTEYSKAIDIMKAQLGAVNNEYGGSAFWNSFDFFARKMKDVGPITSMIGKNVQEIGNKFIGRVVAPIEKAMAAVATDETALYEINAAMNLNASLKGWRGWTEDGKLLQKVDRIGADGKPVTVLEPVMYGGPSKFGPQQPFQVQSQSVRTLLLEMQGQSSELRNLTNTIKKIQGSPDVNDIGFWAPSLNPVNKFIAYVHNPVTDETKLLWGRTSNEFNDAVKAYKEHLASIGDTSTQVYTKAEQPYWNTLNGRLDVIHMERADTGLQKAGSTSSAIVKSDATILGELAGGYQHYISAQVRTLADVNLSEVTDSLRRMSAINKAATANQPLDSIKKVVNQPKDAAGIVLNTLLGSPNLGEYAGWASVNKSFETGINMALNKLGDIWGSTVSPLTKTFLGGKKELTADSMKKVDYEKFADALSAKGIVNPYQAFDDEAAKMFGLSKLEDSKDTTKRIIYASNALAATAALRFAELAQPIVNALSLPILTSLAIAERMPASFLGVQKATTAGTPGVSIMYDGARAMNSPLFESLNKRWEELGYFKSVVSEVNAIQRASRSFERGIIPKIENGLDSAFVNIMSKPADYSEALVRKLTMNTGAVLAKRLYPELDDAGVTIFARDFMDKAVGNFHASQRPVFFQGTLGVALGLFQTYSLSLAQSIYRGLEMKNYVALGKASLLQSSIFGAKSMPGFDQISNAIGDHFSDENVDLVSGTFRAVGDGPAKFLLYGLPSNLGPSLTGRGDVNPRLPGVNGLVAYNFLNQTGQMLGHVKDALSQADNGTEMGRALVQSLSLQSMSRPLARTAELATGYSITGQGNTVQVPEEVWTPTGVFARVLATRPLEEQKLRDADHMNRYYGAIDRDNREKAENAVRNGIRNGTLSDDAISKAAADYMRHGGTPGGWNAALNNVTARADTSGKAAFLEKLKPDSPLNFMISQQ